MSTLTIQNTDIALLDFIKKSGIIDLDDVQEKMKKEQREHLLSQHKYKISQSTDDRWYTYLPCSTKKNNRKQVKKASKEELIDYVLSYYENESKSVRDEKITFAEIYTDWLKHKSLHTNAGNYITRIESDWKRFYEDSSIIHKPVKQLTKIDLDSWIHKIIKEYQLTKNAYYNMAVIIRQGLDYAVDLGIIEMNPFKLVKVDGKRLFRKVKKKADETQVFFTDELKTITSMAWEDFHNRTKVYELAPLAFLFQFQTGLRLGELCAVRYEDIGSPDSIHIQRMLRRDAKEVVEHTKSEYGDRYVILTTKAKQIIDCAKERQKELGVESDGYIFSVNGLPLTERCIADLYRKYCRKAGILHKSSHKSRKTYISALLDNQVNINTIREMVGHADERTTFGNYCFDRNTEPEKLNKIECALKY